MAISASDILVRYSTTSGSAGNTTAGTAAGSLGKYVSTTDVTTSLNGQFDDISGAENAASTIDYRGFFILNNHATLTAQNVVIYLSAEVAGGAGIALAVDSTAASAKGASPAQGLQIANETTAPAGPLTFSSPTTVGTGIAVGDIPAGSVRQIWVRRTAANSAALDADGYTLGIGFDTAA